MGRNARATARRRPNSLKRWKWSKKSQALVSVTIRSLNNQKNAFEALLYFVFRKCSCKTNTFVTSPKHHSCHQSLHTILPCIDARSGFHRFSSRHREDPMLIRRDLLADLHRTAIRLVLTQRENLWEQLILICVGTIPSTPRSPDTFSAILLR